MPNMSELCVFIVDDDAAVRSSLSRSLRTRGYKTEAFASAQDFLDTDTRDRYGCMILDYGMPNMSGLELQQKLLDRKRMFPIIFITGHGGVPEAVEAVKHGAIDFLEKPFRQDVLINRIEAAFATVEQARESDEIARKAQTRLDSLTEREREIAEYLVLNPSRSSSKDVARHLEISPRTVDHHRARILEKMQVASVAELVNLAMASGLFAAS